MIIDITGRKFNKLTAVKFIRKTGVGRTIKHYWLFKCDCGKTKIIRKHDVTSGHIKSCGCLFKELLLNQKVVNHPRYGKHHSIKSKKKIGDSRIYPTGNMHPRYGKKHSRNTKLKMSKNHSNVNGKNNPNWCNGKSFEKYSINFNKTLKENIRKRDKYVCQECGLKLNKNKKLAIHHIDYNKKNNKENNLVSLCNSCHSKTNFKRSDWAKYFKEKLYE